MTTRESILQAFRDLGPCGLRPVVETLELDHAEAKAIVEQLITDRHLYQQSNKQYTVKCPREQQPLRKASRQSYEERTASDKQLAALNDHMTELGAPDVKPVLARARQFMDYQAQQLRTDTTLHDRLKLHGMPDDVHPVEFIDQMAVRCRTLDEAAKLVEADPMLVVKVLSERLGSATQPKPIEQCTVQELAEQVIYYRAAITEIRNHVQSLFDV